MFIDIPIICLCFSKYSVGILSILSCTEFILLKLGLDLFGLKENFTYVLSLFIVLPKISKSGRINHPESSRNRIQTVNLI